MENKKESVNQKTDSNLEDKQETKKIEINKSEENTFEKGILSQPKETKNEDGQEEQEKKPIVRSEHLISKDKLLEYGTHYGHETRRWNPAMKPFIAKAQKMANSRKQIHMISPVATEMTLENSYNAITSIASKGGTFLFVGTNKRAEKTIQENSERAGVFYVNHRWLGGTLTNFRTIQNSVKKLRMLERLEKSEFEGYTKKEALHMAAELAKLEKSLGGIKYMRRLPTAIFVTSIFEEDIAIKEADKLRIPVFGIADTNVDPSLVRFPIVANDDANKSIALITTLIADAIVEAKGGTALVAYQLDENVDVMGIEEIQPRPQQTQSFNRPLIKKYSNKPTEKQVRVLVNNGFTAEGVTFAMANQAISIIAANEWKLKGKEKEVSEILKQEPKKRQFTKNTAKPKAQEGKEVTKVETKKTAKVEEKEPIKTVKQESVKAVDTQSAEKNMEEKSTTMETTKEFDNQISLRMQALLEKATRLNAHNLKLIDIKGIGVKTVEYMHENNIDTIGDLINLDKNLHKGLIAGLPGIKLEPTSIKNVKFINFLEQAHLFLDDKEEFNKVPSDKKSTEEQTDLLIIKEHDLEIEEKMNALKEKALAFNAHGLKLIDIKGIGVKTVEYMHENNIDTIGDLIKLNKDTHKDLIAKLPGLKSETIVVKNTKFIDFLKQAHLFLDEHQSKKELTNEQESIPEQVKDYVKQIILKIKNLKEKAIKADAYNSKLIDIKGIGVKTIEYMHKNNINTIGDLINLDANIHQGLIAGLPGIKAETIDAKNIKFIEFIEQAYLFLEEQGKASKKSIDENSIDEKQVEAKKADSADSVNEKEIKSEQADKVEEKTIEEEREQNPLAEEVLVVDETPIVKETNAVKEDSTSKEANTTNGLFNAKYSIPEAYLSIEFENIKNKVDLYELDEKKLEEFGALNKEVSDHFKKYNVESLGDLIDLSEEEKEAIIHGLPGEKADFNKKHNKLKDMLTEIHDLISDDFHKLTDKK